MSCTDTGIVPCTNTGQPMWGCNYSTLPPTCVIMAGGQFTSQTDCHLSSNCVAPPKGFFRCVVGNQPSLTSDSNQSVDKNAILASQVPCSCIWDANATSGYATYGGCASDTKNCCNCVPPPQGCPPGETFNYTKCDCELPNIIGPMDSAAPCIQTEDCGRGWYWNWEYCKCMN